MEIVSSSPQRQLAGHIAACRQRIPDFIAANYAWRGALRLNRRAWGADVLVAPFNPLMGFPSFVLRVLAVVLDPIGARKTAHWLLRKHLGLPTAVQQTLTATLMTDLLDLSPETGNAADPLRRRVACAAREPVKIYVQTRNVAADITAGTLAAITGSIRVCAW